MRAFLLLFSKCTDDEDQAASLKTNDGTEEDTDEKVTMLAAKTIIEPNSFPEVDQLQHETERIEQANDNACVNSRTNQKNKSGGYKKLSPQEKRSCSSLC